MPIYNLNMFEKKVYSQNGEDGILQTIFYKIGTTNKYCVEFGVERGDECNTRFLIEKFKWKYLHMDAQVNTSENVHQEVVTPENINTLFKKYKVPETFDLLSIDIDSLDYWVWAALANYTPRVVVIEYNSAIPPNDSSVINPNSSVRQKFPDAPSKGGGAGLLALDKLAKVKGYTLVACDSKGINAFFIKSELGKNNFLASDLTEIYKPPSCGVTVNGKHKGYYPEPAALIKV